MSIFLQMDYPCPCYFANKSIIVSDALVTTHMFHGKSAQRVAESRQDVLNYLINTTEPLNLEFLDDEKNDCYLEYLSPYICLKERDCIRFQILRTTPRTSRLMCEIVDKTRPRELIFSMTRDKDENFYSTLIHHLAQVDSIRELRFTGCEMGMRFDLVRQLIEKTKYITTLGLVDDLLCFSHMIKICTALQRNATITTLDLEWNHIHTTDTDLTEHALDDLLKPNTTLTKLLLEEWDYGRDVCVHYDKILEPNRNFVLRFFYEQGLVLDFGDWNRDKMSKKGYHGIYKSPQMEDWLATLTLCCCEAGIIDDVVMVITRFFGLAIKLRRLDYYWNLNHVK